MDTTSHHEIRNVFIPSIRPHYFAHHLEACVEQFLGSLVVDSLWTVVHHGIVTHQFEVGLEEEKMLRNLIGSNIEDLLRLHIVILLKIILSKEINNDHPPVSPNHYDEYVVNSSTVINKSFSCYSLTLNSVIVLYSLVVILSFMVLKSMGCLMIVE